MAVSTATVTMDLADQLGVDFDTRRTKAWVTTNVPGDTIVDTAANKIRLGSGTVTVNADGTASVVVWVPGADSNPASWQTTIHVDYPDRNQHGGRGRRDFGPFTITASADLADLVPQQEIPAVYLTTVTQQLDAKVAEANAAADRATSVANISTSDALVATLVPTSSGSATSSALAATYGRGREVMVEKERLAGDTDAQAIQRAVTTARLSGATRIVLPKSYNLTTQINLSGLHGVTIEGEGADRTLITASAAVGAAFTTNGACSDLLFKGLGMVGNVVDDVSLASPRRARTTTGSSFVNAFLFRGNQDPRAGSPAYEVRNIRFEDMAFEHISSLPVLLQGVAGECEAVHTRFDNCLDPGWIFCDVVKVYDFTSRRSADNGISLSRGNRRVILDGFDIEGCAYHGVWASGYEADGTTPDLGPTDVVITSGVVKNAGIDGIQLFNAPTNYLISDVVVNGCRRGPADEPQNQGGVGIKIGGHPYNTPGAITTPARNGLIANVQLLDCARGGIHMRGVTDVHIDGALIVNPGSEFQVDGTTAVGTGLNENFGVAVDSDYPSTVVRPSVRNVRTIDTRATPLTNVGVSLGGSIQPDYSNNSTSGALRNPQQYDGAVAASGRTGTAVRHRFLRDGVAAFDLSLNSSNELELVGRSTADGSQLGVWMTVGRVTGKTTMGGALSVRRQSLTAAASLTFDANLYNHFSVILGTTAVTSTAISNPTTGEQVTITAVQDTSGGRAFPWPSNCKFAGGAAPTDTTANRRTSVTFGYDGTNWNEISRAVAVG